MIKGDRVMKLLKIEDNQGHFLDDKNGFTPVDKITKEDILRLVDLTLEEEVEFDEYDADTVKNPAHQIIYSNIYDKLNGLKDRKQEFKDESERLYLAAYDKYREDPSEQDSEGGGINKTP